VIRQSGTQYFSHHKVVLSFERSVVIFGKEVFEAKIFIEADIYIYILECFI
jgi:hypothetical protein